MKVILLRHGVAEDQRAGRPDSARRLTAEGREKLRPVLERARGAGVKPGLILASPYARAMETAGMASDVLKAPKAVASDALLPSSSPERVWAELRAHADQDCVLLAGHEPLFSETASFLLGCSRIVLEVKKGAMLCIEVNASANAPRGVLCWLITPRIATAAQQRPGG